MTVTIRAVSAPELPQCRDEIVSIYARVFALPPYNETKEHFAAFGERFLQHATYDDFRCMVASERDALLGFAYGYRVVAARDWPQSFRDALGAQNAEYWLAEAFELVELAVLPEAQEQGIGGSLHDAILRDLTVHTALLTTAWADTPALRLYEKRGWVPLLTFSSGENGEMPQALLGLKLHEQPVL